ncbi:undecaprenyl-diphosphate phosphatase [Teredinibacter waterburyi]|jgi:Undecaprenyl-diphosphatase (EC 3.6.1.27)|uniref:undecaprenyl-diphosphate phosphatase n=1 Tax=Teredinibacter waterburyi TaxID=1500538 RepID=UPI00165F48AB|nr:undecaprenyl-diphosphate phosphatase [Teredinibacter waterburyi]
MDTIQVIVLALIQGITEFLPISSSAHLILPKEVLGWPDQGLAFDVAVHLGTLSAVVMYFRRDIADLLQGWFASVALRRHSESSRLAWLIILATLPAGLFGLLLADFIELHLRSIAVIAATTIIFGVLLGYADRRPNPSRDLASLTIKAALIIGFAQALAMIPGTSRSGITITAALLLGFSRHDSARFSFLLSIPIIVLSASYIGLKLLLSDIAVDWASLTLGIVVSGVSAYFCIHYFLSFINRLSMLPFVIYRLVLGAGLILLII